MRQAPAIVLTLCLACVSPAFSQAPARPPALNRVDPNSPAQAGRQALYNYLDDIAAKYEAERREQIAKITTREQAEARQREVRDKIFALIGGGFQRTPLNAKITGSTYIDGEAGQRGFRIEKVLFESQPKFYVTALLYLPDNASGKLPAIVVAPGHGATGKAGDYAMAATFARNGFAVLSYDPIGQGERLQYPDPAHPGQSLATRPTGEHGEAGLQPTLIGDAVARYFGWDGMRAVDYLVSRPEIDPDRIGAFGCSGGGAMTAMLGAADKRVKAIATACYITSMDTLLPSIGPQDAEQSMPGWIAGGPQGKDNLPLDFADWVELAAPRHYAIVGTTNDMFPWKGLLASATEARRFYSLFDPSAEGTPTGKPLPPTPTGPTLNPDTSAEIPPTAPLQVIAGIGGHGNLRPLQSEIVKFFLVNLAGSTAEPVVPPPPAPGTTPAAMMAEMMKGVPAGALQVTPTGQVLTSYPGSETVHSLNLKRAEAKLPKLPETIAPGDLQKRVRDVTAAVATAHDPAPHNTQAPSLANPPEGSQHVRHRFTLNTDPGIEIQAEFYRPANGRHKALLVLRDSLDSSLEAGRAEEIKRFRAMADAGTAVIVITPRPSPPGSEETKSPILGPFYMSELRAEIVGKTLLGMRVDDVIRSVTFLASGETIDPENITAEASGHMGLVLLHAAVLDPRIKHVTVDHVLESYHSLLEAPMPIDAPQDVLPGVLLHYDIPQLVKALGDRATVTNWLPGTADLGKL